MEVVLYPDPVLRRGGKPIAVFDAALKQLAAEMLEAMYAEGGVGLAAPQVAIEQKLLVLNPSGDAADRSGVAKVEFYLNNGKLIGVDTQAPFECTCEIRDTFIQTVYAVAHDNLGNSRKSLCTAFGDGTVGPSMLNR